MPLSSHLRLTLRQLVEFQAGPKPIGIGSASRGSCNPHLIKKITGDNATLRSFSVQRDTTSIGSLSSFYRPLENPFTSRQPTNYYSSTPNQPPPSSPKDEPTDATKKRSTKSTSDPFTEAGSSNKSIFAKLWDRYSFEGQTKRIILGERLFRAAQARASDV